MTQLIRVVIADDHPLILFGTGLALERHTVIEIVGRAANSTELIDILSHTQCDIVVTDLAMPGGKYGDGLPLMSYLKRHFPQVKVVVLTMLENAGILHRLQLEGVKGIINKNDDVSHIGQAVMKIMEGRIYMGPSIRTALENAGIDNDAGKAPVALSKRESEVVRLFVGGLRIKQIALHLNRSVKTISTQKSTAMRKIGLESDADLYQYGIAHGLVNLPAVGEAPAPPQPVQPVVAGEPG